MKLGMRLALRMLVLPALFGVVVLGAIVVQSFVASNATNEAQETSLFRTLRADDVVFTYKGEDWWDSELIGRWTKGNTGEVQFKGPTPPFRIKVKGVVFPAARPVTVSVNGQKLVTATMTPAYSFATFEVPASLSGPCCTLVFSLDDKPLVSPKALGQSGDERTLGFMFSEMTLEQIVAEPAAKAAAQPEAAKAGQIVLGSTVAVVGNPSAFTFTDGWWDKSDEGGRWTKGNKASVRIDAPKPPFRLQIRAAAFPKARPVKVIVNGKTLGQQTVGVDYTTLDLAVPAKITGPCCDIAFQLDDAKPLSPKALNQSQDDRTLGLLLKDISILPAP